ncbi:MAG: hypothetical protein R2800_08390 [Flavipsychrobacter sp.]
MKTLLTAILSIAFLSMNAQTVYRAKTGATTAATATVTIGASSTVTVQTAATSLQPTNDFVVTSPTLTVSISGGMISVTGGTPGAKIWWVPFDNGETPSLMAEIDEVVCTGCPQGEPTPGDCVSWVENNRAKCRGCDSQCSWKSVVGPKNGSYLLVEANTLIYNGTTYQ